MELHEGGPFVTLKKDFTIHFLVLLSTLPVGLKFIKYQYTKNTIVSNYSIGKN